jgi:peroxiredoxin
MATRREWVGLQQKLDALTAALTVRNDAPQQLVARVMADIQGQVASGQAERALKAGDPAPSFRLQDQNGESVSLSRLLARGPLVISFYRDAWCCYCNLELQALEDARAQIEARGASLVAISMQDAAHSGEAVSANHLGFPSLVDADGHVAAQFGLLYRLSPQMIEVHRQLGQNLEKIHGAVGWSLLIPARYVIGLDGIVAYADIDPDFTHRAEPSDMFPILEQLARSNFNARRARLPYLERI